MGAPPAVDTLPWMAMAAGCCESTLDAHKTNTTSSEHIQPEIQVTPARGESEFPMGWLEAE